jgi:hypothetical protein
MLKRLKLGALEQSNDLGGKSRLVKEMDRFVQPPEPHLGIPYSHVSAKNLVTY